MRNEKIVGKTKANKAIAYGVRDGEALYCIYFVNGGQLPDELTGAWNDPRQIENAIIGYLNKDKLCAPDQAKKDYRANINAAKRRPNKLKAKSNG